MTLMTITPTAVQSANYTAKPYDFVLCDTTVAGFAVALPTAPPDRTVVGVKLVILSTGHAVTVATGGTDAFNVPGGATTLTLTLLFQGVTLQYQGAGGIWVVLGDDLPLSQLDLRYLGGSGGGVSSFNTRTGAVTAATGDYAASQITGLGSAALASASSFDTAGAASTAQGNSEMFATSAVAAETTRAQAAEATKLALAAVAVQTGNYTGTAGQYARFDLTAGSATLTLPTAPADRTMMGAKIVVQPGTSTLTVAAGGTDVFNMTGGSQTLSLSLLNQGLLLLYSSVLGGWIDISDDLPLSGLDARYVAKSTLLYYARDYGVLWNGTTDDSTALTALISTVNAAGGGIIKLPTGTGMLQNVTLLSGVILEGMGYGATVCQLAAGSTGRIFVGQNFTALKGTTSTGGIYQWGLRDMALDGNYANCPNGGNAVAAFGYDFDLKNLRIRNTGAGDYGCYFDYGSYGVSNSPDSTEVFVDNVEIHDTHGAGGMYWNIHDSMLSRVVVANCAGTSVVMGPGASGTQLTSHHYWGVAATVHLNINQAAGSIQCTGCQIEGATSAQVIAQASEFSYVGGKIFDPAGGNTSRGLQIGSASYQPGGFRVDTIFDGLNGGAVDFTYDTGANWITGRVYNSAANPAYVGTPSAKTYVNLEADGLATGGTMQFGSQQQPTDLVVNGGSGVSTGAEVFPRTQISASNTLSTGTLNVTMFTPPQTVTVSNFGFAIGTAMVGGTLAQAGLFTIASGNLTLVARCVPSTAALFASGYGTIGFDPTLASSYTLQRGVRYAYGLLQIGASTAPTAKGMTVATGVVGITPVLAQQVSGQSSMPTTMNAGSLTASINVNWGYLF